MRNVLPLALVLTTLALTPALCAEKFKDVPKDHWAAESVQQVASDGVMKGYPDTTFKGDKPVTRYELAVALERMIAFIEGSLKPEVKSPKSKAESPKAGVESGKPKVESRDPAEGLKAGGYIAANSPLLTDRERTVSPAELSAALASVAAKLIEKSIPPPKE